MVRVGPRRVKGPTGARIRIFPLFTIYKKKGGGGINPPRTKHGIAPKSIIN